MALQSQLDLFVVAGEASGDVLAHSILAKAQSTWKMKGVTGPMLDTLSIEKFASIEDLSVSGTFSALSHLPKLFTLFRKIRNAILRENPKGVLLVDNAEFSLLLAKSLRKKGYQGKIIQLVAPSVWAWRTHRKKILEDYFDLLLVLYPFEEKIFDTSKLKVHYIGHPTAETIASYKPTHNLEHLEGKTIISSFPGSRKKEIQLNLPLHIKASRRFLEKNRTLHLAVAASSQNFVPLIQSILKREHMEASIILPESRFELMRVSRLALAKFGTVNLELGLMKVPTIATFPLPLIERWILGSLFKIYLPHYCLTNILTEMRVFPEYLGPFANVKNVELEIGRLLADTKQREQIISGCLYLEELLSTGPKKPAAEQILAKTLLS